MLFSGSIIGLLISFTFTTCISVQFPPDEGETSNSSARSKSDRQSKALHNYIVTSRPYQLVNSSNLPTNPKWRRELYITTTLGANNFEPSGSSFQNDCSSNAQSCQNFIKQDDSPTFRPYSQAELDKILREYRERNNTDTIHSKLSNSIEPLYGSPSNIISASTSSSIDTLLHDKSKSYHHASNQHKNPYDDRQGWVTLEPVAWSSSQVQKWEPNPNRPTWPVPSEVAQWNGPSSPAPHYPEQGGWTTDRPWKPPSYQYGGTPSRPPVIQSHYTPISSGHLQFANTKPDIYGPPHGSWGGGSSHPDIITDGRPDFPPDEPSSSPAHKPWGNVQSSYGVPKPHTQVVYQGPIGAHEKPSYPSEGGGEGHWVLLSSTKGYSVPQRHRNMARSIRFDPDETKEDAPKKEPSVSSMRSVRLTVLPPLNGSKDTQITHGGMIEVEKTHQTVDEAHREHMARSLKFPGKPSGNSTIERVSRPNVRTAKATARMDHQGPSEETANRDMRLAAVGAGVIPATMAMILPVILARKKRSVHRGKISETIAVLPADYHVFNGRPLNQRVLHVYE